MTRVGVHISRATARVVIPRERLTPLYWEVPLVPGEFDAGIGACFAGILAKVARPDVVVALGPAFVQTRVIAGLPAVRSTRDLRAIIHNDHARYFAGTGADAVVAVRRLANGAVVDSFSMDAVGAVTQAARGLRMAPTRFVSAASALAAATGTGVSALCEDGFHLRVTAEAGRVTRARRMRPVAGDGSAEEAVVVVPVRFFPALGAAKAPELGAATLVRDTTADISKPRALAAYAAMGFACVLSAAAPLLGWNAAVEDAKTAMAELRPDYSMTVQLQRDLTRDSSRLQLVAAFRASRFVNDLLGALSRALPDSAALYSFAVDSSAGMVGVIAARASDALASIDAVAVLKEVRLTGSITSERVGEASLERVSVHFVPRIQR